MVFHGKPSKACAECRQRRTKCDLSKPSCSQCIRANRTCPGYREGLIIHDESEALWAKFSSGTGQKKDGSPPRTVSLTRDAESTSFFSYSINDSRLDRDLEPKSWVSSLISTPAISAEDQATSFFFGNYVAGREMRDTCGNYQYLSAIYANQPVGIPLRQAIAAVGLAGLANFWKAPSIMAQANNAYCTTLRLINTGLGNIEEAKSDQTVVAILLLGLYETNTTNGARSMKSWTEHILGATALIQLRGKKSLSSYLGRNIFVHLRNGVIASCVQRHSAVPKSIYELTKFAMQYETPVEKASTNLGLIVTEYTALRSSMSSLEDLKDLRNLVASLWDLDIKYLNWAQNLPPEMLVTPVPAPPASRGKEVWGEDYHLYNSIYIAGIWNNYRCARILNNELLRQQVSSLLHWGSPLNPHEMQTEQGAISYENILHIAISTISSLANDIFASVPFFLSTTTQDAPRALAGNLVLWPLYLAAKTTTATTNVQIWAAGRLGFIANTIGIRNAAPPYAGYAKEVELVGAEAGSGMEEAL